MEIMTWRNFQQAEALGLNSLILHACPPFAIRPKHSNLGWSGVVTAILWTLKVNCQNGRKRRQGNRLCHKGRCGISSWTAEAMQLRSPLSSGWPHVFSLPDHKIKLLLQLWILIRYCMICLQCPQGRVVSDCICPGRPREGPVMAQGSSGRGQGKGFGRPRKSPGSSQDGPGRAVFLFCSTSC